MIATYTFILHFLNISLKQSNTSSTAGKLQFLYFFIIIIIC